jgi:hypothetical protein
MDATGIADVDQGEIIVIDKGGAILDGAAITALGNDEIFYIVEGKLNSNVSDIISPRLTKGSIAAHRGTSYAAPVEAVTFVGSNGVAGEVNVENSTEYTMNVSFIYDKDIYSKRHNSRTYSYVTSAAATQEEIADGLVAVMNSDANFASQAVAAKTNETTNFGISITGKALATGNYDNPVQVNFNVSLDKGFTSATRVDEKGFVYLSGAVPTATGSTSVSPNPGVGTAAQFKAMEANNIGFTTGQTNKRAFPVIAADPRIESTVSYDVYVIDYTDTHESADNGLSATRTTAGQIIVANDIAGTANTTALEVLFAAITGVAVNL